jgi:hypothetical protein
MKLRHSLTRAILDRERDLVARANHEDPGILEVPGELLSKTSIFDGRGIMGSARFNCHDGL